MASPSHPVRNGSALAPEPLVAAHRVIGTLSGGIGALIVHAAWAGSERARLQRTKRSP